MTLTDIPMPSGAAGPNGVPLLGRALSGPPAIIAQSVVRTQAIQMVIQLANVVPQIARDRYFMLDFADAIYHYIVDGTKAPPSVMKFQATPPTGV